MQMDKILAPALKGSNLEKQVKEAERQREQKEKKAREKARAAAELKKQAREDALKLKQGYRWYAYNTPQGRVARMHTYMDLVIRPGWRRVGNPDGYFTATEAMNRDLM